MSDVKIQIRDNGPFLVQGAVELTDGEGNAYSVSADQKAIALCRCGQSANRPFCDGAHNRCGFESAERVE